MKPTSNRSTAKISLVLALALPGLLWNPAEARRLTPIPPGESGVVTRTDFENAKEFKDAILAEIERIRLELGAAQDEGLIAAKEAELQAKEAERLQAEADRLARIKNNKEDFSPVVTQTVLTAAPKESSVNEVKVEPTPETAPIIEAVTKTVTRTRTR